MRGSTTGSQLNCILKLVNDGKLGITQTLGPGYKIMSKVRWLFGKIA